MCMHSGWGNGRSVIQMRLDQLEQLEQLEQFQLISCGEAHCELCVTQKVIDALLKALSTPWWTASSMQWNRTPV